jgi:hypothetical protein
VQAWLEVTLLRWLVVQRQGAIPMLPGVLEPGPILTLGVVAALPQEALQTPH